MSWRTVTESDLISTVSASEADAFRASFTEDDPIDRQVADTVAFVRGIIRSAPSGVSLSADESQLPASLIRPAMDYLRFNLLTRMNDVVNESRKLAYEKACQLFDDVRSGKFIPESADEEDDSGNVAGSPLAADATPERLLD